jgi:hypothetical protein
VDLDTIWMCVSFLENGMLRFRVELLAVVQRDQGVADRAADERDHGELADQRAVRDPLDPFGDRDRSEHRGDPSESSPPGQHRDGGEQGGSGVAEHGTRRLSEGTPYRQCREACRLTGGDQADPPGGIAVEDRPRQDKR